MLTVDREYKKPNGKIGRIKVALCKCFAQQRGPLGGMCVICGGAITSVDEQRAINTAIYEQRAFSNQSGNHGDEIMSRMGAKIIEGLKQAADDDFARVTVEGQTWERVRQRSPGVVELTLLPRDDGGLRICSETNPGIILSGPKPEEVLARVWPAILALRALR